jgi:hypothetical protein
LSNNELLWILQALTVAAVNSVLQFGGHVIEFTGDGVMAVFGDSRTNAEAAAFSALSTTAFLMKGVQETVNPRLENFGTETVRTAVGMEFGDILWSRIGVLNTTQVKPISEATFLAGKLSCGGKTKAWEAMVGANLAEWIPSDFKVQVPKYKFMADGVEYSRDLFLFKWAQFATSNQISNSKLKELLFRKKLRSTVQKSPYLAALKLLTEAGFNVFLDDSSDCPHLVINFDVEGTIAVIITLDIDSVRKAPSVFLRQHGQLEKIEISTEQWIESSGNLTSIVAALRNAQMRR